MSTKLYLNRGPGGAYTGAAFHQIPDPGESDCRWPDREDQEHLRKPWKERVCY